MHFLVFFCDFIYVLTTGVIDHDEFYIFRIDAEWGNKAVCVLHVTHHGQHQRQTRTRKVQPHAVVHLVNATTTLRHGSYMISFLIS